jgi:emp24/gp25L/p24 family/GOLD
VQAGENAGIRLEVQRQVSMQAQDSKSNIIFSAQSVIDDEFEFRSKAPGVHTFCLITSGKSKRARGRRWIPVQIDITMGETWNHDRVTQEHLDELLEDISYLSEQIQKVHSDLIHFKHREMRHR